MIALLFVLLLQPATPGDDPALARILAARARGDAALAAERFEEAGRDYRDALVGAPPILRIELEAKVALVGRRLRQRALGLASLVWIVLALGWLSFRAARGRAAPLRPPIELLYVAPLYLLLVLGALGRDRQVLLALALGALGSMAIIAASGLAARRAPLHPLLHAAVLVSANAALFYVVLWRVHLLDILSNTVG